MFYNIGRTTMEEGYLAVKKKAFVAIAAVLILAITAAWYFTPKTFAKGVNPDEVDRFSVFDGQTGTGFQVTEPAYVKMIVRNLQGTALRRSGISLGRMGYGFSIEGIDKNGKTVIPLLYLNDSSTIRKDPFFYSCNGELCFDFLKELEPNLSAAAALPGSAVMQGRITDVADGTLYLTADNGNYFVNDWLEYIPDGPTFEIGDEITIKYSGIATETAPAGLCGVTEIDLTEDEYIRKYGIESAEPSAPEYPGVYGRTWSEEIVGTVMEMHSYIVLNEDHTGYWIAQDVGALTWEEGQLMLSIGAAYGMALTQEGETVNLLVSEFPDDSEEMPTVFEKIDGLPAQIESLLAQH